MAKAPVVSRIGFDVSLIAFFQMPAASRSSSADRRSRCVRVTPRLFSVSACFRSHRTSRRKNGMAEHDGLGDLHMRRLPPLQRERNSTPSFLASFNRSRSRRAAPCGPITAAIDDLPVSMRPSRLKHRDGPRRRTLYLFNVFCCGGGWSPRDGGRDFRAEVIARHDMYATCALESALQAPIFVWILRAYCLLHGAGGAAGRNCLRAIPIDDAAAHLAIARRDLLSRIRRRIVRIVRKR